MTLLTRSNDEDDRAVHDWILLNENSRWYCGISDARDQYNANEEHHAEVKHLPFTWTCEVLILNSSIIHGNLFIFEIPKGPSDLIDFQKLFLEIDFACYTTANGYSSSLDYLTLRLPQWFIRDYPQTNSDALGLETSVMDYHRLLDRNVPN